MVDRQKAVTGHEAFPGASGLPAVVHVSGDFPDPVEPFKTQAIRALIDLTRDQFAHHVFSINRRPAGPAKFAWRAVREGGTPRLRFDLAEFEYGQTAEYEAPGRGFFHKSMLVQLGGILAEQTARLEWKPDLLVAHKLTIEGLPVARMAKELDVPFALCIQGDTDTKILAARPDLAREFAKVFHEARVVFPFTPWSLEAVESRLGKRSGPVHFLPCATELDEPLTPAIGGNGLISVFHLKNYRRKNLSGLANALRILRKSGEAPRLEIVGGGNESERLACQRMVSDIPEVSFAGGLDREAVRSRMNGATAMVLPSLRESFGLVFVEALFAGTPVIYPKGTAIDGYFEDCPFAIAVDARDPRSIAAGIRQATANENDIKLALREWQAGPAARRFQRESIGQTFAAGLRQAIA